MKWPEEDVELLREAVKDAIWAKQDEIDNLTEEEGFNGPLIETRKKLKLEAIAKMKQYEALMDKVNRLVLG